MINLNSSISEGDGTQNEDNVNAKEANEASETRKQETESNVEDTPTLSFGYHSLGEQGTQEGEAVTEESKEQAAIDEVNKRAMFLASEVSNLMSKLQVTVQDACELTHAHVKVQKVVCDEVELIVESAVNHADQLVKKVVSLSNKLNGLDELSSHIQRIDKTLIQYEKIAAELITRRRKRKALEAAARSKQL